MNKKHKKYIAQVQQEHKKLKPLKMRRKRVTRLARMDVNTHRQLKLAAVYEGKTVSRFLDSVVADYFERHPEQKLFTQQANNQMNNKSII